MLSDAQKLAYVQAVHHGAHPVAACQALGFSSEELLTDCAADQDFCSHVFTVLLEYAIVAGVERFSAELEEFTAD